MENFESFTYEEELEDQIQSAEVDTATASVLHTEFDPNYRTPKKKKTKKVWKVLICCVLVVALVAASSLATVFYMDMMWEQKIQKYYDSINGAMANYISGNEKTEEGTDTTAPVNPDGMTPAQVYAANVDAVVAISNQGLTTNIFGQTSETASSGSGFIISEDGYVVSNYHVVSGANVLSVITSDGNEYDAKLVGYDESNDLSVLKIEAEGLTAVKLGSSDALVEGDQVAAIGNPLGELTSTLTVGYISAKNRTVNTDGTSMEMLQTDAAINSGNSGGPLFNMKGEVVGITTAKYSGTSNAGASIEGIGFAIPIDDIKNMIEDLRTVGYIKSGYLGVMVQDVNPATAEQYGLPLGALVSEVTAGSCADKAGIQPKDIITHVGNRRVESLSQLTRVLGQYEGGEDTVVTVYRGGQSLNLPIVLDTKPQQVPQQEETQPTIPSGPDWFNPFG